MSPVRVAVACDYPEEGWASMDLVGEMILTHLNLGHAGEVAAERVCPPFRRRLTAAPAVALRGPARNADRLLNRFVDYPRALAALARRGRFDLFHLVDHSYSQLVHAAPPGRAVVTCHDLDTFRCLLEPDRDPRPRWFRAMAGRILSGFRKAAAVACVSEATRDEVLAHRLVPADRVHVILNGIPAEFGPDPDPAADAEADRLLGPARPADLLHVGSTIPRKRIDVLLSVFAEVRRERPDARLVRSGGALTPAQEQIARDLGVLDGVVTLPRLTRAVLASVYRRSALVLQPSESEGFGLPVAEALACGTAVLASDLPALREVGAGAADYRPFGDVAAWSSAVCALLDQRLCSPDAWQARRADRIARARLFSWSAHADRLVSLYKDVLSRPVSTP